MTYRRISDGFEVKDEKARGILWAKETYGGDFIEAVVPVPDPKVEQIAELQSLLSAEDWKVTRQTEQNTMNEADWTAFKAKRQGYRDQIDLLKLEA